MYTTATVAFSWFVMLIVTLGASLFNLPITLDLWVYFIFATIGMIPALSIAYAVDELIELITSKM